MASTDPAPAAAPSGVVESRRGRVLSLVLHNPAMRNALRPEASRAMAKALRLASEDDGIGAVVVSGEGAHFCAGGDLRSLGEMVRGGPRQPLYERIAHLNEFVRAIRQCDKPVIAAVEGHAAGAGCVIALACDLIVAAENAQFTMAYVKAGLTPDGAGTWFLARAVAPQLAAEMAMTGAAIGARRRSARSTGSPRRAGRSRRRSSSRRSSPTGRRNRSPA